jgi:hypothetical protein
MGGSLCSDHDAVQIHRGLRIHTSKVAKFHLKVLRKPIPALKANYDRGSVRTIICPACASEEIATLITSALLDYSQTRKTRMAALRATPVYVFNNDQDSWTVIEWIGTDGIAGLAIFHFDDAHEAEQGSWLMHSGLACAEGDSWRNDRIDWNVRDVEHLKILFGVVAHVLGVLEWSVEDAFKLYCRIPTDHYSDKELHPRSQMCANAKNH